MSGKRSHGEGSVYKRKNGTWRGQLMDGYTDDGKKRIVSFNGKTKGEVLDMMRDYKNQMASDIRPNREMTVGAWGEQWYRDYGTQVQASTYAGYRYTLDIIKARMGTMKLCDVLPLDVTRVQNELAAEGRSLSLIRKVRTMLIQLFDSAEDNGLVARNPARRAKTPKDKDGTLSAPRQRKDAFSVMEIELLRRGLNYDLVGHSIRLMLGTGLRVQELLALAPEDIAEDGSTVNVNKAVKTVAGKSRLGPPKSKSSYRAIPVPESYRVSARYLRTHGGKSAIWQSKGEAYSVSSFRTRYYREIARVDGVRKLSPHCCRHTYVTRLQASGVSIELIAQLAGHSTVDTTVGYTHTSLDTLVNAVSTLEKTVV